MSQERALQKILQADETGCLVKVLSPIEGLSEEQIKNNEDYFSIMEENLENLVGALK